MRRLRNKSALDIESTWHCPVIPGAPNGVKWSKGLEGPPVDEEMPKRGAQQWCSRPKDQKLGTDSGQQGEFFLNSI